MKQKGYPKIGIALGSGGAKGLAHIGVLKTLEANEIKIDYMAGSSIGALIGAYYAAYPSFERLEEFIFSLNRRKGLRMLFDPVIRGGLLKGNKIELLIADLLEGAEFDSLRIPFSVVTTDVQSAKEIVLTDGDLIKALRASMSVPAIFKPVPYGKKILADGGLSDPVPVQVVRSMGSDIVIAVNVESNFHEPHIKIPSLSKTPMHTLNIMQHNLVKQSLKTADIVITPKLPPIGLIGWGHIFDTEKAQRIIKLGEEAAKKALPELEQLIKTKKDKRGFRKYLPYIRNFLP